MSLTTKLKKKLTHVLYSKQRIFDFVMTCDLSASDLISKVIYVGDVYVVVGLLRFILLLSVALLRSAKLSFVLIINFLLLPSIDRYQKLKQKFSFLIIHLFDVNIRQREKYQLD